jgi:hypothetical protein
MDRWIDVIGFSVKAPAATGVLTLYKKSYFIITTLGISAATKAFQF